MFFVLILYNISHFTNVNAYISFISYSYKYFLLQKKVIMNIKILQLFITIIQIFVLSNLQSFFALC